MRSGGILCILCVFSCVSSYNVTGKGFYCRDPDTGKLYPINATWTSTTFCGSYTCKLRKKPNEDKPEPLREFKVIHYNISDIQETKPAINCSMSTNAFLNNKKAQTDTPKSEENDIFVGLRKAYDSVITEKPLLRSYNGDRYLTQEEISALTLLLRTMKKSDIEGLIEVYNLAQDIYKEIDQYANMDEKNGDKNRNNKGDAFDKYSNSGAVKTSYWYEPLSPGNFKTKQEAILSDSDIQHETKTTATDIMFQRKNKGESTPKTPKPEMLFASFPENGFKILPFYHPMTSFQRESSYMRSPPPPAANSKPSSMEKTPDMLKPANHYSAIKHLPLPSKLIQFPGARVINLSPHEYKPNPSEYNSIQDEGNNKYSTKTQVDGRLNNIVEKYNNDFKEIPNTRPLQNLQYSVKNEDMRKFADTYFTKNPYAFFTLAKTKTQEPKNLYVGQVSEIIEAESGHDMKQDDTDLIIESKPAEQLAEWQTVPLDAATIDDVRANIKKRKLLPFPFRKHVKLERVPQFKAEDMYRKKRGTKTKTKDTVEAFEVYLEKSMCKTETEPGFFRMGNTSEPFPACCPQRILS